MAKFAFIFSVENKCDRTIYSDGSTGAEKMAIALAKSIREHHPDVDMYCGSFTNHKLSEVGCKWLGEFGTIIQEVLVFDDVGLAYDTMFLRSYTKFYFSGLLKQYDYLIYVDIDAILLKPLEFDFDPTGPIVVVDKMPEWVKRFQREYTNIPEGNLYYNWVDVINKHNEYIYDMDYSGDILLQHHADIEISCRIDSSNLRIIDQNFGGYHCFKPLNKDSQIYHYDNIGREGTFYNLKHTHLGVFLKYKMFFLNQLGVEVQDHRGYWEEVMRKYS